eukprot:CAMPEP_0170532976 /NCGR_PEP_ID=MMETSP0209-20121228/77585_1 /TAXON_ID=665100 ORGANISM="Litonotus pictus, Strain P1" /NCGR_SAMPLE_ID=MMETSP0209 /ASSEMBLY_ACC=CAM_ASM_000301 /LENGTH=83 /DNA_ID=CAMNT_0010829921 /DNA_START=1 /DNA_END=248 /DNA_ORIENTATION=-
MFNLVFKCECKGKESMKESILLPEEKDLAQFLADVCEKPPLKRLSINNDLKIRTDEIWVFYFFELLQAKQSLLLELDVVPFTV